MRDTPTQTVSGDATAAAAAGGASILVSGTRIANRYVIEAVLGVGGSAVVYRAYDERLAAHVALKLMRSDRVSPAASKPTKHAAAPGTTG